MADLQPIHAPAAQQELNESSPDETWPGECWTAVVGKEGLYQVSQFGRIRVTKTGKVMKPYTRTDGYKVIGLCSGPRTPQQTFYLHIIVCRAFHGEPVDSSLVVAHRNGKPADCRASNLRWATQADNIADKEEHGTKVIGEKHHAAKLTEAGVRQIFAMRREGKTLKQIASIMGIHFGTVSKVLKGIIWSHIKG